MQKADEMNTFILQSLLLIALAYLLGAIIGCWLRKMFRKSASVLHSVRDEIPLGARTATVAGAGVAGAVAAKRLAGDDGEASIEISRPEPPGEQVVARETVSETVVSQSVDIPQVDIPVTRERETITIVEPEPDPEPAVIVEETVAIKQTAPAYVEEKKAEPVIDDLTRIKGVGLPIALELKKIGVTRFAQVAAWTDEDVAEVSRKLGFTGRIERENWMAQARILADGDDLSFTTHQLTQAESGGPAL